MRSQLNLLMQKEERGKGKTKTRGDKVSSEIIMKTTMKKLTDEQ
jgi:hypothetical protein